MQRRVRRHLAHAFVWVVLLGAVVFAGFHPVIVPGIAPRPTLAAGAISVPGLVAAAPTTVIASIDAVPVPLTVVSPPVSEEAVMRAADGTAAAISRIQESLTASSQSVAVPVEREAEQIPLFYRYEVIEGDNISRIASRFGIASSYIVWNNADVLDNADLLTIGDALQIPSVEGIIHAVRLGETLTEIADRYDADVQDIIDFRANGLADPNLLSEGAIVLVPGGQIVPAAATSLRPDGTTPQFVTRGSSAYGFSWPVLDEITSYYGPYHPLGIDINALYVPVAAAAAGQVILVYTDCCSYGMHVEIRHTDGYTTVYAHLSEFNVQLREWVEQGQVIGVSGNTGRSSGPHLHFELRRYGVIQNPLVYLP